ncbi:MAG: hypothetical protein IJX99_04335 [Clostridia bacterium]|nr:hypothetical protein [Clostridia bacterium]
MLGSDIDLLITVLIIILAIALGGIIVLIMLSSKGNASRLEENSQKELSKSNPKATFNKHDVMKFMEFDKIEDDMIIQENGNKFIMVLRCQGINYDLMSETEMLAVEEGFSNFLNTLKYPIQLYVQARSLNLEESINTYKERLGMLREDYNKTETAAYNTKRANKLTLKEKEAIDFEVRKKKILLEYGADIINYVEKMSLNRNILQRKYYVVVSYYASELGLATNFTKEEAHDLAYSELYTRCRSIASALTPCGVESSIMKSDELAEMLYIAYNKDDADVFNIKKAIDNGFYRLYSTAQDVLEKKQIAIDNAVREQAVVEAELALKKAVERLRKANDITYEEELSDNAKSQAMQLILDNSDQFDPNVVDMALTDLNSQMKVPVIDVEEAEAMMKANKIDLKGEGEESETPTTIETPVADQIVNNTFSTDDEANPIKTF